MLFQGRIRPTVFVLDLHKLTAKRLLSAGSTRPPTTSTVQRGNAFEERSLSLLEKTMSMSLKRVGGKEDGGIDLLGWWWLPYDTPNASSLSFSDDIRRRLRVVGQCKAEKKKMGPNFVRELEGVVFRFLATSSEPVVPLSPPLETSIPLPVVALLVSQSAFTKSTLLRAQSSPIPFLLLHLPAAEDSAVSSSPPGVLDSPQLSPEIVGHLGTALCNPALIGTQGLLKGQLEIRWERHPTAYSGRPALWWNNEKLHSSIPTIGNMEQDSNLRVIS